MYTKKFLSAVVAMAVLSSGAMAFDAWHFDVNGTGTDLETESVGMTGVIVAERDNDTVLFSSYKYGNKSDNIISKSSTNKGDALIYPAFNQKDNWGTEIVVRNTSNKAIVAKAVIYDGKDSHEVKDFNIYLSPYDVSRFTIKDGRIKSNDGSLRTYGINPHQATDGTNLTRVKNNVTDRTDYAVIKFGNKEPFDQELKVETGYVIIYGMEQVNSNVRTVGPETGTASTSTCTIGCFHNDHAGLYAAYAASLDRRRGGWRDLTASPGNMFKGMFKNGVTQAPNINASDMVTSYKWYEDDTKIVENNTTFGDVEDKLTG
ncbi:MAG: hypothetical protein KAU90_03300, partial [Sulfurovaceae bacterium]|nr:hypothetical protein [Sulfurovaceae bacterium]